MNNLCIFLSLFYRKHILTPNQNHLVVRLLMRGQNMYFCWEMRIIIPVTHFYLELRVTRVWFTTNYSYQITTNIWDNSVLAVRDSQKSYHQIMFKFYTHAFEYRIFTVFRKIIIQDVHTVETCINLYLCAPWYPSSLVNLSLPGPKDGFKDRFEPSLFSNMLPLTFWLFGQTRLSQYFRTKPGPSCSKYC